MESSAGGVVKSRGRFPKPAVRILKDWFRENASHPFPSEEDKSRLGVETGLSKKQISFWFTNARRRDGTRNGRRFASSNDELSSMNALDRWKNSPPELESASLDDIAAAVARTTKRASSHDGYRSDTSGRYASSTDGFSSGQSDAFSTWSNSDASTGSQEASSWRIGEDGRRQRKRTKRRAPLVSKSDNSRKFQCTFCTDRFKTKYDWTRHEATQHLSLESWICAPFGPRSHRAGKSSPECAFCGLEDPTDAHFEEHNYADCARRPPASRTFHRKDHLRQHLHLFHGIPDNSPMMDEWKSTMTSINCRCGFCGETFDDWSSRNDHLADHFRAGALMKDWRGYHGLSPAITMLVRNAMPPYLIAEEATTLIPFSAESGTAQQTGECANSSGEHLGLNWYEEIESRLAEYVSEQRTQGVIPTDAMLQRQARLIIYGDNDPWNQTAADNPQWLEFFKSDYGIGGSTRHGSIATGGMMDSLRPAHFEGQDSLSPLLWDLQELQNLAEITQWEDSADLRTTSTMNLPADSIRQNTMIPETLYTGMGSDILTTYQQPFYDTADPVHALPKRDLINPALCTIGPDPDWMAFMLMGPDGSSIFETESGS